MDRPQRIAAVEDFWTREFALYLLEHRDPRNRLTHMIGIPILLGTAAYGLLRRDLLVLVLGQVVGWAFQLAGHRFEGNRPALLERPISVVMGPLMVLVEMGEYVGVRPKFSRTARQLVDERPPEDLTAP